MHLSHGSVYGFNIQEVGLFVKNCRVPKWNLCRKNPIVFEGIPSPKLKKKPEKLRFPKQEFVVFQAAFFGGQAVKLPGCIDQLDPQIGDTLIPPGWCWITSTILSGKHQIPFNI